MTNPAPIELGLANPEGKAVITIGNGLPEDELSLVLRNRQTSPLSLRGGPPVPEGDSTPTSPSTLYLHWGELLTPAQQAALQIEAPGWTALQLGTPATWALAPASDTELAANAAVTFKISRLDASPPPASGYLTVDYVNLGDVPASFSQIFVARQSPPPEGAQPLGLTVGFTGLPNVMVTTDANHPIENSLVLRIANPSPTTPLVPEGTKWEPSAPPVFFLSFVYGSEPGGYFALTTQKLAQQIQVAVSEEGADTWKVDPRPAGENPQWTLRPQAHAVLGVGANAIVELSISDIVTELPPGPTLLYLQHANIPRYADGVTSVFISKVPPIEISDFRSDPIWANPGRPASVTLHWQVSGDPSSLELRGPQSYEVTGKTSFEYPHLLDRTTNFTLHATRNNAAVDANTQFDVVDFPTLFSVDVAEIDYNPPLMALRSRRWDTIYVAVYMSLFSNTGGGIGVYDGTTGQHNTDIAAPIDGAVSWMWIAPPVVDDVDRLALTYSPGKGTAVAEIWDVAENHAATRVASLQLAGQSSLAGFLPSGEVLVTSVIGTEPAALSFSISRQDALGKGAPQAIYTYDGVGIFSHFSLAPDGRSLVALGWTGKLDPHDKNAGTTVGPVVAAKVDLATGALVNQVTLGHWPVVFLMLTTSVSVAPDGSGWVFVYGRGSTTQALAGRTHPHEQIARLMASGTPTEYPPGTPDTQVIHVEFDAAGSTSAYPMTAPLFAQVSAQGAMAPQVAPNGTDLFIPGGGGPAGGLWAAPTSDPVSGRVLDIASPGTIDFGADRMVLLTTDNQSNSTRLVELGRKVQPASNAVPPH